MLQKQLEYIHREFLVDTQWVEDPLNDPKSSIAVIDYDSDSRKEIKKERIKKTSTVLVAIITVTAMFAVTLIAASAAIVHHKVAADHIGRTPSCPSSRYKQCL
jgi:Mn2+/Fe2+ NRAMP family transporter